VRSVFLKPRAHARQSTFLVFVLPLLGLTALAATPAVAVAPSVPPVAAVARLTYTTGTEKAPFPYVWIALANGREPRRLGPGSSPLLAPNGQSVAAGLFGTVSGAQEQGPALAIYPASGAAPVTFLNLATATATPLAWSPDSRYLAVSLQSTSINDAGKLSGLAVIDTTTGAVTTIANGQIYGASFAQDGSDRIVYGRAPSQLLSAPTNVYVSGPSGSGLRALSSDGRSLNPVWGSRYIAYDRERLRHNDAPIFQIWLAPAGGGRARRLIKVPAGPFVSGLVPIDFSSNGRRLLSEFEGQDTSEAWTVLVPSGRARRLTVRGQSVVGAGLSRDGSTVLIGEKSFEGPPSGGRVAQIPFAGGRSKILVAHGSQASWNG
jgi:hypothetical protein